MSTEILNLQNLKSSLNENEVCSENLNLSQDLVEKEVYFDVAPPYCSGTLHLGHLYEYCLLYPFFNLVDTKTRKKTLKESTTNFKDFFLKRINLTMLRGVDVNGMPLTRQARSILETQNKPKTLESLFLKTKELQEEGVKNYTRIFKLLGLDSVRSLYTYTTNGPEFKKNSTLFLDQLIRTNRLTRRFEAHYYCGNCKSFISKAECSSLEEIGPEYQIDCYSETGQKYKIMTTRPEYIVSPSCFLVVNPTDKRYSHLIGLNLSIDLLGHKLDLPVYASTLINPLVGTGLAYIAPWHSELDLRVCKALNLHFEKGLYEEDGSCRIEVQKKFQISEYSQLLQNPSFLKTIHLISESRSIRKLRHTQRGDCKSEIQFKASDQILIDLTKDTKQFSEYCKEETYFSSRSIALELENSIKNLNSWCISRTPQYYSLKEERLGLAFNLDTWVPSSLSYLLALESSKNLTPSARRFEVWRLQGSDITNTWAFYSKYTNFVLKDKIPVDLKKLFFHKMVLDSSGAKFSKSKKNAVSIEEVLKKYSLRNLRLYFCSKPLTQNFKFIEKELLDLEKTLIKFKNLQKKWVSLKESRRTEVFENQTIENLKSEVIAQLTKDFLEKNASLERILKNSKLLEFLKSCYYFFSEDVYEFKFSVFLNNLKAIIYSISKIFTSEAEDLDFLKEYILQRSDLSLKQIETNQLSYLILDDIFTLIAEFFTCFE